MMGLGLGLRLRKGSMVEVSSDEDGFVGSWYAAKVVCIQRNGHYAIQYQTLVSDAGEPLVEQVTKPQLRPSPPLLEASKWSVGDAVEAYDNDGWWTGVVQHLPSTKSLLVYFPSTLETKEFLLKNIRTRQDWLQGKWTIVTQGLQGNASKEANPMNSEEQVARTLIHEKERDAQSTEPRSRKSQKGTSSDKFALNSAICNGSQIEIGAKKLSKQPLDGGSVLITQSDKNVSQGVQNPIPSRMLCELPCRSDSSDRSREMPSTKKQKKNKRNDPTREEQEDTLPLCEHGTPCSGANLSLDADKSLCLLESQSERLSKGTSSPGLQQMHASCVDKAEYILCLAAKRMSQSSQKDEHHCYENRARLQIARNSMSPEQVHPCEFNCRSFATGDFTELESPSGNHGATRVSANKSRTHKLELKAYVAVLQAFYSKGPLTWQQELLITDLRTQLNISWEEHLLQLLCMMSCSCEKPPVSRDSKQQSI